MKLETEYNINEYVYVVDDNKKIRPAIIKEFKFTEDGVLYFLETKELFKSPIRLERYETEIYRSSSEEEGNIDHGD